MLSSWPNESCAVSSAQHSPELSSSTCASTECMQHKVKHADLFMSVCRICRMVSSPVLGSISSMLFSFNSRSQSYLENFPQFIGAPHLQSLARHCTIVSPPAAGISQARLPACLLG